MYRDVSCFDRTDTEETVRETLFAAAKAGFQSISVPSFFLSPMKEFVVDGIKISCPIDYPYGTADTAVRSHAILAAIRKGATQIDLVANNSLIANKKYPKFYEDIESAYKTCTENRATLRILFEYRFYDTKEMVALGNGVREIGIEEVFPATGSHLDEWQDNLMISATLRAKCGLNVITNGNLWKKSQYDALVEADVFGVRFSCKDAIKNIFG